jgi:hypothetical protein
MSGPRAESKVNKTARTRKQQRDEAATPFGPAEAREEKPFHRIRYYVVFNRIVEDPCRF